LKDSIKGSVTITIDDRVLAKADASGGNIRLFGRTALKIVRGFAKGKRLSITQSGTLLVQLSLSGASAALRYMDAQQGRDGGVTALAALGRKPASAIKQASKIAFVNPGSMISSEGNELPATLPTEEVKRVRQLSNCPDRSGEYEDIDDSIELKPLDAKRALMLLECGPPTLDITSVVVIVSGKPGSLQFAAAVFDDFDANYATRSYGDTPEKKGFSRVGNPEWNPLSSILETGYTDHNLLGCGEERSYLWDGSRFQLLEAAEMPECRGSYETIRTWVASRRPAE
jgi:hypothetical protein